MKLLELSKDERRTLREMGIFHAHPRTRMRAQGILRLSQGLTLQQTADEFIGKRSRCGVSMSTARVMQVRA
jgi:hypothetical protein